MAISAKNAMTISLWAETKDSIIMRGFKAKTDRESKGLISNFLDIFSIKYADPIKLPNINSLNKQNVNKKYPKPIKDNGTVNKSHTGPYGQYLCVQCIKESMGSLGKSCAL